MEPEGIIVFSTVGVSSYGFDVFSAPLPSALPAVDLTERRYTDGVSVNFNAQFLDEGDTVAFVSERTGSSRLYQTDSPDCNPKPLPSIPETESLFHDRPTVKNGRLYFVSAHEPTTEPFKSWSAVYFTRLDTEPEETVRLTPPGTADLSPAVSRSGDLIAVASYGSGPWKGDFRVLQTDIVVFRASDPSRRAVICPIGGWPAWSGDSTVFFHRVADDGWWSIYRVDLTDALEENTGVARRITPPGLHAFTPAASHDGKYIAVATRRKGRSTRQIEIFDLNSEQFHPITELINPGFHHYNPFFSPGSGHLGYHRFRGESAPGDSIIPYLQPVRSPVSGLRMLRTPYTFPSFSPAGDLIAMNGDFLTSPGLMVVKSDGTRRWTLLKEPSAFYTVWSPSPSPDERGVLFMSIGPIFESTKATVQIARVSFDPDDLDVDGREEEEIPAKVKILTRTDAGNNAFPSCSPDGRHLVFRSGRSGHKNLYILDSVEGETGTANGGGIRRLTEGEWIDTMPCWSPDGELIAFSSNRHSPANPDVFSIYLIRPDGSGLRRVPVASADVDRERINHVCFSPDSKWLLFTANLGGILADPVGLPNQFQPYGDLYICRLDGTGLRRLTCNAYENGTPAWYSGRGVGVPDVGSLSLRGPVGDKLRGLFEEPLWITCDL